MIIREVFPQEKENYNRLVPHPLQSWEWGEFRLKTGNKVLRLGVFEKEKLLAALQVTIHQVPKTNFTMIYFPKGNLPDGELLDNLIKLARDEKAIFIKLEPQILISDQEKAETLFKNYHVRSGRPLFTKYTFWLDLTKSEEELMAGMKEKTRYNIRLAQKHGVTIVEDNSAEAFENYLKLLFETTNRQGFYAHNENYHRLMWQSLQPSGIAHLLKAQYQDQTLASWILFTFNNVLYYPYGASSREHKEVMASSLLMWEAIRFGQKMNCRLFDMWGSLGPNPNPKDSWYGFHRFKEGFGAKLVEFVGTYDLVLNPPVYSLYNFADNLRWKYLRLKSFFS